VGINTGRIGNWWLAGFNRCWWRHFGCTRTYGESGLDRGPSCAGGIDCSHAVHFGRNVRGFIQAAIVSPVWLTLAFSLVMLIVAYRIFFNKVHDHGNAPCKVNQTTGRLIWDAKTASFLAGIGVVAGLLTGLLGVGGGFVIVPALRKFTGLDMRSIVATSLMIIFLIGGVSIYAHVLDGFQYPVSVTLTFVLACTVGMLIGRSLMHRIDSNKVQKIFATTVVGVAMYLIYSALMG